MPRPSSSAPSRSTQSSRTVNQHGHLVLSLVSGILLVLLAAVLCLISASPLPAPVSRLLRGVSSSSTPTRLIASTNRQLFCPGPLGLSDKGSYGDQAYAATAGNLDSSSTLLALGSVYEGQLLPLGTQRRTASLTLPSGSNVGVTRSNAPMPLIVSSRQLTAVRGEGLVGSAASWASTGDVRGLAAAPCGEAVSQANFLLPSTRAGNSARLLVANVSDKSTLIDIRSWGSSKTGEIHPAANSQISIAAQSLRTIDLAALTGHENAVFVRVHSSSVAVHLLVETSAAQGLIPHGVDFAPTVSASRSATLTGLQPKSSLRLLLFSKVSARVEGSWLSDDGQEDVRRLSAGVQVGPNRVQTIQLGRVPEKVRALCLKADHPVYALMVQTVSSSNGQEDYSLLASHPGFATSVLALPRNQSGSVTAANPSSSPMTIRYDGIGDHGERSSSTTVDVPARSTRSITISRACGTSSCAGIRATLAVSSHTSRQKRGGKNPAHVSIVAALSSRKLSRASVAQSAVLPFSSLMPQTSRISAVRSPLAAVGNES